MDSITGLVSPVEKTSTELNAGASTNLVSVEDATVYSGTPTVNYGSEEELCVGEYETGGYARTYMKFDVTPLVTSGISYNAYAKDYFVIYDGDSSLRLLFHLQSDSQGNVYLVRFTAYDYTA